MGKWHGCCLKGLQWKREEKEATEMNATYQPPEDEGNCLEKYGTDLTELARTGKLDPVIGLSLIHI